MCPYEWTISFADVPLDTEVMPAWWHQIKPIPISSNDFSDYIEEKYKSAATTISPFLGEGYTNSLRTLIPWFVLPEGSVPYAA